MRLYFPGPLFSAAERAWNEEFAAALRTGGHEVFLPQDKEAGLDAAGIFRTDVGGIDWADALLAIVDGADPVAGTAWEVGYAYGKKPIVLVRTDLRTEAGSSGPYSPMLTQAATIRLRPALRADGQHRGRGPRCPAASGGGIALTHRSRRSSGSAPPGVASSSRSGGRS